MLVSEPPLLWTNKTRRRFALLVNFLGSHGRWERLIVWDYSGSGIRRIFFHQVFKSKHFECPTQSKLRSKRIILLCMESVFPWYNTRVLFSLFVLGLFFRRSSGTKHHSWRRTSPTKAWSAYALQNRQYLALCIANICSCHMYIPTSI